MKHDSGCCCSDCCTHQKEDKRLAIDFLYLDLSQCERCQGAEKNLDEAILKVAPVIEAAGYEMIVNKVNITSRELAVQYEFLSSPTIRINGEDIDLVANESLCTECGDLCKDTVSCRVWTYEGENYTEPPKEMIIVAIIKAVYGDREPSKVKKEEYRLPDNLAVFFDGVERQKQNG